MNINKFYFINFLGTKAFTYKKDFIVQLYDNKYWKSIVVIVTATILFINIEIKDHMNIEPTLSVKYVLFLCFSLFLEYIFLTISANILLKIYNKTD